MSRRTTTSRVRLHKYIADAGVCSRRRAEELILAGRVLVNDEIVETLPAFVDPASDDVIADGRRVRMQRHEYFVINKPKGFICTNRDPAGRPRAVDLLPPLRERLVPVGRLDVDSCGLLLLTNDGDLALRLTHPRYGVAKTYRVEVRGYVERDLPAKMEKGVFLSDGKARASGVEIVHAARERSVLMITLKAGRNRQIRRMLARFGHPVKTLKRVQIGPVSLKRLPTGAARRLTPRELTALRNATAPASGRSDAQGKPQRHRGTEARGNKGGRPKARRRRSSERVAQSSARRGG